LTAQLSFAEAEYAAKRKKTRREVFLEEMALVVPWKDLVKVTHTRTGACCSRPPSRGR
jgi:hypothetical protein